MNFSFCLTTILILSSPSAIAESGKATPDAIREYARECVDRNAKMDLVKQFGTDFRDLDLRGFDLRGVFRAGMNTNLAGADFSGADLRGTNFGAAMLKDAVFRGADLRGAFFTTANLERADLSGAIVEDAHFQECFFTGANLSGLDFSGSTLNGCFFENANLNGAVLQGVSNDLGWRRDMSGASLRGVDLSAFDFSLGDLVGADFSGANLSGVNFEQADLSNANLADAVLDGVKVDAAILDGVTGLDESVLQELRSEADRPGFEARREAAERRKAQKKAIFSWSYRFAVLITFLFCGLSWWRPSGKAWPLILTLVNLFALVPPIVYFLLNNHLDTLLRHASHREIGGLWIMIWPLGLLCSLAMMLGGLILGIYLVFRAKKSGKEVLVESVPLLGGIACTVAHGAFLFFHSFANAPTV